MATKVFRGDAQAVAEIWTFTIGGAIANGQVYTVTANRKTVSYTAVVPSDTNTTAATALAAVLASSSIPEIKEYTWSSSGAVVTATGTAGNLPSIFTSGATGTGTLVAANPTPATGPNDLANAANWNPSGVPSGDDIVFESSSVDALFGFASITVNSITLAGTYTGKIGLPPYNANGYREYRSTYWTLNTPTVVIGRGDGGGSGRVKLALTATTVAVSVEGASTPSEAGIPSILLTNTGTLNLNVTQGNVGVAIYAGETAAIGTVRVGSESSPASDVTLLLGSGVSALGTLIQCGGVLTSYAGVTTWTKRAGDATIYGTAGVTTLVNESGNFFWSSTGTIGTGTFRGDDSVLDTSRDVQARTLTTGSVTKGAVLNDPYKTITFTNALATDRESLKASDIGEQFSLQRS